MRMGGMRGRGCGFGRMGGNGCGRGWRNMFYASGRPGCLRTGSLFSSDFLSDQDSVLAVEKQVLKNREAVLLSELESVRARLGSSEFCASAK